MAISSDYPHPVRVNGFQCRNCTDVDFAKKHIDPQHPKSGPDNRDATTDPTRKDTDPVKIEAAKKAAEAKGEQVTGYSAAGPRYGSVDSGQLVSFVA